ncbi:hypothetical protein AC579_8785 [Pseudocercospora musae]|uniref:Uncharacterized protein n=1 Tax=Pseudocercospora musae TaxID=113226 RepID=A0A139IW81_9PEZI|nr:hypothetical protein AC579_8785 [Pseudocercospora musae]
MGIAKAMRTSMKLHDPFAIAGVIVLCLLSTLALILLFCVARRAGLAEHKKQRRASAMLNVTREVGDFYTPPSMFSRDYQPVPQDGRVSTEMQPMPAATTTSPDAAREQTAYQPLTTLDSLPPQSATTVPNVVVLPATPPQSRRSAAQGAPPTATWAPASGGNRRRSGNRDSLQLPSQCSNPSFGGDRERTNRADGPPPRSGHRNESPTSTPASAPPSANHTSTTTRAAQAEGISPRSSVRCLTSQIQTPRAGLDHDDNMRLPQSSAYPPMPIRVHRPEQHGRRQLSDGERLPFQQPRNPGNRATYPQAVPQAPPQGIQIAGQEHPAILRPRGSLEIVANSRPQSRGSREARPIRLSPVRESQEPQSPLPPLSAVPQPPSQDPSAMPGPSRLAAVPRHQRLPSSPTLGSFTWEGRPQSEGTWFNDKNEEDEDLDRAIALSLADEANASRYRSGRRSRGE